jgi:hypothetical protein
MLSLIGKAVQKPAFARVPRFSSSISRQSLAGIYSSISKSMAEESLRSPRGRPINLAIKRILIHDSMIESERAAYMAFHSSRS